jgi:hypothetical protein
MSTAECGIITKTSYCTLNINSVAVDWPLCGFITFSQGSKVIEGSVSLYSKYPLRALSDMGIGWN